MSRVVITGIGIYSSIGKNLDEVAQSLREGKSGIIFDQERLDYGYRSCLTGYVEPPQLKGLLDRRARIMLSQEGEYAYMSTIEALKMANMDNDYLEHHETGIIFGNDSTAEAVITSNDIIRDKKNTQFVGSGAVFQTMNSTVNMNLATIFKLKGVNFTISAACASGSHAIGLGYMMIKHGYQERVICGGAQEINVFAMGTFDALGAFSVRDGDPTKALRPFDKSRDGLVPSGGAATVIIESLESAQARGAQILGEILGYGFSSNGGHISNPTVEGPQRSLEMALKQSSLSPKDIDYINAHATSTPQGDASEAQAIYNVFGDLNTPVSSTKSMTGHECWMAGASEVVYSMLMMQHGFIAPNINFNEPDEFSAKINVVPTSINKNINIFLSNSFGFGGTNSSDYREKVGKLKNKAKMSNLEVVEKINSLLIDEFEIEHSDIAADAPLKEVLQLDSLDYVDLVVMLEGNFGFKVKQEDFASIKTFANLYDYVLAKMPSSVKS